ncbi:hypothetical protein [Sphingobacterium sp. 1.A.5]|uniref:hypothetical protein n=1 Tax=Sphingobacterium sp. 1.A.5 TaxID=2044604 RepID=UPI000C0BD8FC|nr:hypothetical protein [Sphingobacterium sp. 1.A.5]
MNIQERVLSTLKPLVASKGFGEKTVQGLATNLTGGLTDESTDEEISAAINGAMPMIDLMQSENTRYINDYKKKNPTPANPNPAPNPNNPATAPTGIEAQLAELLKKVDNLQSQNDELTLSQKWQKLSEANGIEDPVLIEKWKPSKEEDFDSAMEELKSWSNNYVKKASNDRSPGKPNSAGKLPEPSKTLTATGKQILDKMKAQNELQKNN